VVGTADLVYLEDGRLVVADYKTDAVDAARDIEERVARYRRQLDRYSRGLQSALVLDAPPAAELWFLAADRIIRLADR